MKTGRDTATAIAAIILAASFLLWPAIVNGAPFVFADTTAYIRGADAGMNRLFGLVGDWTGTAGPPGHPAAMRNANAGAGTPAPVDVVLAGRSVFYGLLLYLSWWIKALWATVLFQAVVAASAVFLAGRRMLDEGGADLGARQYLLLMALLALATPMGFFAAFLMPDLFAAIALLAVAILLCFWSECGLKERAFWVGCLVAGVLFHTATLILTVTVIALVCIVRPVLKRGTLSTPGTVAVALAIGVGVLGELAFSFGVARLTGAPPLRPPFVAARLIADGPGRDYLRRTCPESGFLLCRHLGSLGENSDVMLWSGDRRNGIFMALSPAERQTISAEQGRLVQEITRADPLAVVATSSVAVLTQAASVGLEDFNYGDAGRAAPTKAVPAPYAEALNESEASRDRMPTRYTQIATIILTLASLAYLAALFLTRSRRHRISPALRGAIITVLIGIAANAAICGALSTPHGRYQARLIWLVSLMAILAWRCDEANRKKPVTAASG